MSKEDSLKKKIFICHLCKKAFLKENQVRKHKRKCLQRQVEPESSNASRVSITVPNPNVPQFSIGTVEPEKEKNPQHENVEILDQSYDKAPVMISENEESSVSPVKFQSYDMSFGDFMDIFDQEIEEHPFTLLHEEEDAVHDNMISDILNMETPNLEMMLIEDFNMDHLTPEDEASRKRKSSEMEAD